MALDPSRFGAPTLGTLVPDSARTILAVSRDGELAVGLRDRLDRAYVMIRDVRFDEARAGFAACRPWPWMIVGDHAELDGGLIQSIRRIPALVLWLGEPAAGLPDHRRGFRRFAELAAAAETALGQEVGGMRPAPGLGVEMPDGSVARSVQLQALVTSHPHPLHLPLSAFRSAGRSLAERGIPWRPSLDGRRRAVSLVEAGGANR